jgi:hypothetical protein
MLKNTITHAFEEKNNKVIIKYKKTISSPFESQRLFVTG